MTACGNAPMEERDPLFSLSLEDPPTAYVFAILHAQTNSDRRKTWPSLDETDNVSRMASKSAENQG